MHLIFIFLLSFLVTGCGLFKQFNESEKYKQLRAQDKDPYHARSCGPRALYKALKEFNERISKGELSHEILSNGKITSCVRDMLSIFDNEAREITFPNEMEEVLKKRGYEIKKVTSLKELNEEKDVALVLIKKKWTLTYHWMCFPVDRNILTFFGNETKIEEVYLILNIEKYKN